MEVISTDCTSSSQAKIWSKMSSVKTLSSSITQPIDNFWIPKATSNFFGSLFQVRPSIFKARILLANSSKSVTYWSYIFTSNTTIDLATGLALAGLAGAAGFLATGLAAGVSSSAKGSKSSSSSFFFSSFFSFLSFLSFLSVLFWPAQAWTTTGEKLLMKRYQ